MKVKNWIIWIKIPFNSITIRLLAVEKKHITFKDPAKHLMDEPAAAAHKKRWQKSKKRK